MTSQLNYMRAVYGVAAQAFIKNCQSNIVMWLALSEGWSVSDWTSGLKGFCPNSQFCNFHSITLSARLMKVYGLKSKIWRQIQTVANTPSVNGQLWVNSTLSNLSLLNSRRWTRLLIRVKDSILTLKIPHPRYACHPDCSISNWISLLPFSFKIPMV